MRGRTRPYEERDTSLRREGRVPKIHVRIWQNPQQDLGKSSAGFSEFCKWLENKAIEKRKNYCSEVAKLLQRSLRTSAVKLPNFCRELCKVDLRRPVG